MSSFDQVIKNILTDIFGSDEQEDVVRPKARPSGLGAPTTSLRPRRRPDQDDADEEAIPSGADSASRFIAGMADFDDTPEEGVDIPLATLQTDARNLNGKYRTTAMQLAKLNKGATLTDGGRANVKVAGVVEDTEVDDILAEVKMVMNPVASVRPRARPKSVEEIQAIRKEQRSYTKIDSTRDLQTALNAAGITVNGKSLVEDGIMGKNTRKAIKSFQEREGLKVDGIAGPNTKQALRSVAPDSPIVESLVFDTRPSLAREDQIAGENRFSDALINERLLSSDKSEDVTEPEGLMTRPSVAREGQISGEGALDQFASSSAPITSERINAVYEGDVYDALSSGYLFDPRTIFKAIPSHAKAFIQDLTNKNIKTVNTEDFFKENESLALLNVVKKNIIRTTGDEALSKLIAGEDIKNIKLSEKSIQTKLKNLRFLPEKFKPSNKRNSEVIRAIKSFQKKLGLEVDGAVGPITTEKMIKMGAGEYIDYEKGLDDVSFAGNTDLFSLINPEGAVKKTLGQFNWKIDEDNNLIVTDQYNFNDTKEMQEKYPTEKDKKAYLARVAAQVAAGKLSPYGWLRKVGSLYGSMPDEGAKFEIDLGVLN